MIMSRGRGLALGAETVEGDGVAKLGDCRDTVLELPSGSAADHVDGARLEGHGQNLAFFLVRRFRFARDDGLCG